MAKTVAVIQPSYIPWKGYLEIIHSVDEFILLDTVQYTRRDWRNRNKIKTPTGLQWLSVPVFTRVWFCRYLLCLIYTPSRLKSLLRWILFTL